MLSRHHFAFGAHSRSAAADLPLDHVSNDARSPIVQGSLTRSHLTLVTHLTRASGDLAGGHRLRVAQPHAASGNTLRSGHSFRAVQPPTARAKSSTVHPRFDTQTPSGRRSSPANDVANPDRSRRGIFAGHTIGGNQTTLARSLAAPPALARPPIGRTRVATNSIFAGQGRLDTHVGLARDLAALPGTFRFPKNKRRAA